ncbi:MAG: hypothetical protein KDI46_05520 [Alphaproteobacteria bacterium]|nr:hypothetical protein [Alphaproteobacteria bacterium]
MNIELGILKDGRVTLVSDAPLPDVVRRVEFFRDQRLFQLVYNDAETHEDHLMEYEIPEDLAVPVEKSPNVIILTMFPGLEPLGYKVPLVKVGELY